MFSSRCRHAEKCNKLGVTYIFRASYDKANRSLEKSFRGPGNEFGLNVLRKIRAEFDLPILTDVRSEDQIKPAAEIAGAVREVVEFILKAQKKWDRLVEEY